MLSTHVLLKLGAFSGQSFKGDQTPHQDNQGGKVNNKGTLPFASSQPKYIKPGNIPPRKSIMSAYAEVAANATRQAINNPKDFSAKQISAFKPLNFKGIPSESIPIFKQSNINDNTYENKVKETSEASQTPTACENVAFSKSSTKSFQVPYEKLASQRVINKCQFILGGFRKKADTYNPSDMPGVDYSGGNSGYDGYDYSSWQNNSLDLNSSTAQPFQTSDYSNNEMYTPSGSYRSTAPSQTNLAPVGTAPQITPAAPESWTNGALDAGWTLPGVAYAMTRKGQSAPIQKIFQAPKGLLGYAGKAVLPALNYYGARTQFNENIEANGYREGFRNTYGYDPYENNQGWFTRANGDATRLTKDIQTAADPSNYTWMLRSGNSSRRFGQLAGKGLSKVAPKLALRLSGKAIGGGAGAAIGTAVFPGVGTAAGYLIGTAAGMGIDSAFKNINQYVIHGNRVDAEGYRLDENGQRIDKSILPFLWQQKVDKSRVNEMFEKRKEKAEKIFKQTGEWNPTATDKAIGYAWNPVTRRTVFFDENRRTGRGYDQARSDNFADTAGRLGLRFVDELSFGMTDFENRQKGKVTEEGFDPTKDPSYQRAVQ